MRVYSPGHDVLRLDLRKDEGGQNGNEETGEDVFVSKDPKGLAATYLVLQGGEVVAELEERERDD